METLRDTSDGTARGVEADDLFVFLHRHRSARTRDLVVMTYDVAGLTEYVD